MRLLLFLCSFLTLHLFFFNPVECRTTIVGPKKAAAFVQEEREYFPIMEINAITRERHSAAEDEHHNNQEEGEEEPVCGEGHGHGKTVTEVSEITQLKERVDVLSHNLTMVWALLTSLQASHTRHHPYNTDNNNNNNNYINNTTTNHSIVLEDPLCWRQMSWCQEYDGAAVCSGRGECLCGQCACYADETGNSAYGIFCECDPNNCGRYQGELCGGGVRGRCECSGCLCNPGYSGSACHCDQDPRPCFNPDSGFICSGVGTCDCSVCRCPLGYGGTYCDEESSLHSMSGGLATSCGQLKLCILCHHSNETLHEGSTYQTYCHQGVICPEHLNVFIGFNASLARCRYMVQMNSYKGCSLEYHYEAADTTINVYVEDATVCNDWSDY